MTDTATDKLIRDAYGVVAKPDRLLELLSLLQSDASDRAHDMSVLQAHFDRIVDLLDEIDPNIGDDFSGFAGQVSEPAKQDGLHIGPEFALNRNLRIVSIHGDLPQAWDAAVGRALPDWVWDLDLSGSRKLKTALSSGDLLNPVMVRLCHEDSDESGTLFVATISDSPEPAAALRAIRLRWDEQSGAAFSTVLRLTDTEAQLARYIVDGLTVRQFARARGRSLGTARNQLKALLKKLGIGSQLDLVSLYGGFHASFRAAQFQQSSTADRDSSHHFTTRDGGSLPYEIHGKPDGRPLLYLHATADGALLTPRQIQAARANGYRVIAPWLPFYAGSDLPVFGLEAVDKFVLRLIELLDHLEVGTCPVVTVRVSAPYGFALLKKFPDRFAGLVTAGATTPHRSSQDYAHLSLGYRAPMRLAGIAPGFVKLYFAAAAAMMRKGDGTSFFKSLYGSSPADLAALEDEEVQHVMRRTLQRTFQDGYNAPLQQTLLSVADWSAYCDGLQKPVVMICGKEDGLGPPDKQQAFCETYGFELIGPLDNVGSLAMHQVPRLVFDTVANLER